MERLTSNTKVQTDALRGQTIFNVKCGGSGIPPGKVCHKGEGESAAKGGGKKESGKVDKVSAGSWVVTPTGRRGYVDHVYEPEGETGVPANEKGRLIQVDM